MPLLETALGVALIVGILSLPAALASLLTLMTYWSSDQLIAQYPIMGILSAVVITWSVWAARLSATSLIMMVLSRKHIAAELIWDQFDAGCSEPASIAARERASGLL